MTEIRVRFGWPRVDLTSRAVTGTVTGHTAPVTVCRFAVDDEYVVTADESGLVVVADPVSGAGLHSWRCPVRRHFGMPLRGVSACATGPGGRIAVGTAEGSVHVLRVAEGQLAVVRDLDGDDGDGWATRGAVIETGFFTDGDRLLVRYEDGRVRIVAVATGTDLLDVRPAVGGRSASPPLVVDGFLAVAEGSTITTWCLDDLHRRNELVGHDSWVVALERLPGTLVTTDAAGVVRTWDVTTGRGLATFVGATGAATADGASGRVVIPAGEHVRICDPRAGDDPGTVARYRRRSTWRRRAGGVLSRLADHVPALGDRADELSFTDLSTSCRVDGGLAWIVTVRSDDLVDDYLVRNTHELAFLDPATGLCVETVRLPGPCVAVLPGAGGTDVITVSGDGRVHGWSGQGEERLAASVTDQPVTVAAGSWSRRTVAVGDCTGAVRLVDVRHAGFDEPDDRAGPLEDCVVSPDGTWAATADPGRTVVVWNLADRSVRRVFHGHVTGRFWHNGTGHVRLACGTHQGGQWLAYTDDDGLVRIRHPGGDGPITFVPGEGGELATAAHPSWLASQELNGDVRLLDPRTGELLHTLSGHTEHVYATSTTAEGTLLATVACDGTRLWDTRNGRRLALLPAGSSASAWDATVVLDPLGRWLATTSGHTLHLHDTVPATSCTKR